MSTSITCPSCGNEFEPNDAIRDEVQRELRAKMAEWMKKKDDEFKRKETEKEDDFKRREAEIAGQVEELVRKRVSGDFETRMRFLENEKLEKEARLKDSQRKELEFLQQIQELQNKDVNRELEMQKRLLEQRNSLAEQIRREETERMSLKEVDYQMKMRELEKQLEDQRKLAEEMRRKAEQGSMQLQGEVQELALEELLRTAFPFDVVSEVGKGVRGADCIQTVRNNFGQECGKIIYESKRTKDFSAEWIEKLKADMRSLGADVAVIVTQAMPKDMDEFGEKDGVWICTFSEVRALATVLRDLVTKVFNANKSQENKGDKMTMLYEYLISSEFSEQWKAIREGFMNMKISIQKERDQMEKLWKAREKQLEKVLLNAAHIKGSIEGISGMDAVDLNLIEDNNSYLLD
ncbi:DUF2130 domain-containing protein [Polluticoccus soli]|uniref:DUF2130 domain-containing protein n=1 Tax=Polluticoccus soli TaxID=3034150 RepID=UPI0023E1CA96|nr:DUF2130 domain-containing protein [Flavipsychrobacter sp. JY13-12]